MRGRDYKQFGKGEYFHIYNRGNANEDIFLDDEDFNFFILRLKQNLFPEENPSNKRINFLPADSFSLICYCLMPNHFHLLIRQNTEIPTSKLLLKVCTSYSIYFNKKYKRSGHVFQDRFKQILVTEDRYLIWLSAYIHQNPKIINLVRNLEDYYWSSYREFIGLEKNGFCTKDIILDQFDNFREYKKFVESSYDTIKKRKEAMKLEELFID